MKKGSWSFAIFGFSWLLHRNSEELTHWTDDLSFLASCQIATQEINSGWWGVAQSIIFATELPNRASYVVSSLLTTICSRVTSLTPIWKEISYRKYKLIRRCFLSTRFLNIWTPLKELCLLRLSQYFCGWIDLHIFCASICWKPGYKLFLFCLPQSKSIYVWVRTSQLFVRLFLLRLSSKT